MLKFRLHDPPLRVMGDVLNTSWQQFDFLKDINQTGNGIVRKDYKLLVLFFLKSIQQFTGPIHHDNNLLYIYTVANHRYWNLHWPLCFIVCPLLRSISLFAYSLRTPCNINLNTQFKFRLKISWISSGAAFLSVLFFLSFPARQKGSRWR